MNGGEQKSFREIITELVVAKELSNLRKEEDGSMTSGFTAVLGSAVIKGNSMCYKYYNC